MTGANKELSFSLRLRKLVRTIFSIPQNPVVSRIDDFNLDSKIISPTGHGENTPEKEGTIDYSIFTGPSEIPEVTVKAQVLDIGEQTTYIEIFDFLRGQQFPETAET